MRKIFIHSYSSLTSIENLFQAWDEFKKGKRKRSDVQLFERYLEDNLFELHQKLVCKTYKHDNYHDFYVHDPKRRHIHKACVADRIVHHLLYKRLYEVFDKTFISDSYSCRLRKGTHAAVARLERFARIVSKNYTHNCWVAKCDIKKFFATIDHQILTKAIAKKVKNKDILWLTKQIIDSFHSEAGVAKGIPIGNLTSQVFANIYLAALDQFLKHQLKVKYYLRFADDFLILDLNRNKLTKYIDLLKHFLANDLKLELHPKKINLRKLSWGVDFCGYLVLPHYRLVRTKTRRRIFQKVLKTQISNQALQSYIGYFAHAESYKIIQEIKNISWLYAG